MKSNITYDADDLNVLPTIGVSSIDLQVIDVASIHGTIVFIQHRAMRVRNMESLNQRYLAFHCNVSDHVLVDSCTTTIHKWGLLPAFTTGNIFTDSGVLTTFLEVVETSVGTIFGDETHRHTHQQIFVSSAFRLQRFLL